MLWAKEASISDGTNPEGVLTREQLITMLYRYAKASAPAGVMGMAGLEDVNSISDFAADAMRWGVMNGIIAGYDAKLNPQGEATRSEFAAMMQRLFSLDLLL